ncbi:hypothetical protein [Algoriphagus]|jgi:hypothetical protein|uniref:Uncharacterized protein n=2 Tax=Algoriphagus TaxID=246875 RepID=A0ABS7N3X3_9BACT|nr:hypothetical protein [Algoriphagus]MBY5949895.1 hypothetical protein [Algoriphagus marincola]MCR9083821.1 hypothetical protein [Cyclobacteriaceae bacterium]TDK42010.1 hypothetical protein E1898_18730 [Algoriphagus aquimaris]
MSRFFIAVTFLGILSMSNSWAQSSSQQANLDSLRRSIVQMDQELYEVQLNLHNSKKQLKTGIFIATIGYTVTIIGGQLLGSNPDAGKALLYVGGATGIVGTVVLVNGFNKISLRAPDPPRISP